MKMQCYQNTTRSYCPIQPPVIGNILKESSIHQAKSSMLFNLKGSSSICRYLLKTLIVLCMGIVMTTPVSADDLTEFDLQVKQWAEECREELNIKFEQMISSQMLNKMQLFDTFYIPIPNTYPQKYHTQYDKIFDNTIQDIIDKYQSKDKRILFVIAVDRNGYLPTHNSIFSQPLTGERETDALNNRTKRIFNDRTGLTAAQNKEPYLLQKYSRDTGEELFDLSIPVFFKEEHWGAVRIGYMK
ncbi:Methyl-accepting chemotaxis sensory transducer (modular protein) [Desulfamplus magnetovallimortis]|uniref:Methyl-accepting chemotaxis sensory transducer (Modular protein) n=1 Tax=Desulfamplus magnetovallimortis TaxID=1246637 RepID=A0A1W1H6M4_9BACT|nr:hypothetical protein [Desulfamplus magnetovallimortis]SLM28122.1 Methyl-accepting chemotaxis sensory transducer (modular protein) [Desulfamplus magnetovallimortis]